MNFDFLSEWDWIGILVDGIQIITWIVAGLASIYVLISRNKSIYGWKSIIKYLNRIAENLKGDTFIPNIIIGNSIISNLLDEHFPDAHSIQVLEISKGRFESQREFINNNFIWVSTERWMHLVSKSTLDVVRTLNDSPKVLIMVNYVQTGVYFRKLYDAVQDYLGIKQENIKVAALFVVQDFQIDEPSNQIYKEYVGGEAVPLDYTGKIVKMWKRVYMPWGHVSKYERNLQLRKMRKVYLATRFKLFYYIRANPPKNKLLRSIFGLDM